ncbi:acyl-CoA dehydrogenase family protein [Pseudonocardia sp. RS010]|uniref:acyl-CoA dehydrogenase family protein n=1 Tax=Pseudonocardia sp. RS010 TaxID=3385979 RepID=UPI0039A1A3DD
MTDQRDADLLAGDFYGYGSLLTDDEQKVIAKVREFCRTEVAPIALDAWSRAEFPHDIVPKFAALDIAALPYEGSRGRPRVAC